MPSSQTRESMYVTLRLPLGQGWDISESAKTDTQGIRPILREHKTGDNMLLL